MQSAAEGDSQFLIAHLFGKFTYLLDARFHRMHHVGFHASVDVTVCFLDGSFMGEFLDIRFRIFLCGSLNSLFLMESRAEGRSSPFRELTNFFFDSAFGTFWLLEIHHLLLFL
jgi:hypothetical protein